MICRDVRRKQSGFTLGEVLLVLVLMGIITFLAVPRYLNTAGHVQEGVNKANVIKLEAAAQKYYLEVGSFPTSLDDLLQQTSGTSNWKGPYLDEKPECPFGSDREYVLDHRGRVFLE